MLQGAWQGAAIWLALAVLAASPAGADPYLGLLNTTADALRIEADRLLMEENAAAASGQTEARPPAAPAADFSYTPDPDVAARTRTKAIQAMRQGGNAPATSEVERDIAEGRLIAAYRSFAERHGYQFRNLAHSYAALMLRSWQVANLQFDVTPAQEAGARLTAESATTRLASALSTSEARQEFDELTMYRFVLLDRLAQTLQSSSVTMQRRFSDGVYRATLEKMGLDLRRLRLTDRGFASQR